MAIEKIRKDNEDLKEELLLENKLSVRPTKQSSVVRIAQLQNEADAFTRKVRNGDLVRGGELWVD